MPYQLVDHTADLAVELSGESLTELFCSAAVALCDLQGMGSSVVEQEVRRSLALEAAGPDRLLVRWLQELLLPVETEGLVATAVRELAVTETTLEACVLWRPFTGPGEVPREIKAVTYHGLKVMQDHAGRWRATVVLDV